MIRINLLSTKRKKKQYQVYTFLIQAGVILGLTVLVVGFLTVHFIGKVSDLKDEKAKKEKRLEDLKAKIKEVENYEKDNESYKEKTQVIEQLK
ncbi:MAG: hypothetical protein HY758_08805 [Nitrospirae bacterium]|nr:hypothetical protein [Nitrospirota bacterium]